MKKIIPLVLNLSLIANCLALDIYVSPSGNDASAGTLAAPLRTLIAARNKVRILRQNQSADINVYLRGGTYRLDETLVFNSFDSGMNGYFINYSAYKKEMPILSGATPVTTNWQQNVGSQKLTLNTNRDNVRHLYVNGKRAQRARWGKRLFRPYLNAVTSGYLALDVNSPGPNGTVLNGSNLLRSWSNLDKVEMIFNGSDHGFTIDHSFDETNPDPTTPINEDKVYSGYGEWIERRANISQVF